MRHLALRQFPRTLSLCLLFAVSPWAMGFEEQVEEKITFDDHIKPIFREHCTACHSESDKESDLALDTYGATLEGGSSGEVIAEGNSGSSRLYALVSHAEQPHMPPDQDPIPQPQIEQLGKWIEQGMPENSGSEIKRFNANAAAMLGDVSLGKPDGPPPLPENLLREPVLETSRSAAISALAASPWAPLIAVGGQQQVSLYHCQNGELMGVIPFVEGEPQSLTFTRDGKQLLIAGGRHSHSGCAVLVDIASGERLAKVGDELDTILAADISPDKSRIAMAGPQKIIRVYDTITGEQVLDMKKHTDWIFALRYSPDGVLLASGDRSNGLMLWESQSGNLYSQLTGHKGEIRSLDFRADSNVLATASLDGTVKLWDMYESKEIKSWNAHGGGVTAIAFAHNGMLATAGRDSKIKLWNGNGELQQEFTGLSETALEVALTGDASYVAGGDWNGKVSLWPAGTEKEPQLIAANPPSIERRLADATAKLNDLQAQQEMLAAATAEKQGSAKIAAQQLQTRQDEAQQTQTSLEETRQEKAGLTDQMQTLDERIATLTNQLAKARTDREEAANKLEQVAASLSKFEGRREQEQQRVAQTEKRHQQLQQAAQQAGEAQAKLEAQLDTVRREVEQAAADQAAMQARGVALQKLVNDTQLQATELTQRLEKTHQAQQQLTSTSQQVQAELAKLKEQMLQLQKQFETLDVQQSSLQQKINDGQATTKTLQQALDSSQQELQQAQEELQLYQKSYRKL